MKFTGYYFFELHHILMRRTREYQEVPLKEAYLKWQLHLGSVKPFLDFSIQRILALKIAFFIYKLKVMLNNPG